MTRNNKRKLRRLSPVLVALMVLVSIIAGASGLAAAASASSISASDITYPGGESTQEVSLNGVSMAENETHTIEIQMVNGSDADFTSTSASLSGADNLNIQSQSINSTSGYYEVTIIAGSGGVDSVDANLTVTGTEVLTEGEYRVAAFSTTSYFNATKPDGTMAVGNITTSDGASVSPDIEITDSNGNVVASASDITESYSVNLSEGNYTANLSAEDYQTDSESVSITSGETTNVDFNLQPLKGNVDVDLSETHTGEDSLSSNVTLDFTDKETGNVYKTVTVDSGSTGLFTNLKVGNYTMTASASGYTTASYDISVYDSQTTNQSVQLAKTTDVTINAVNPDGTAADNSTVEVFYGDSDTANASGTVSNGNVTLTIESNHGSYRIEAQDSAYQPYVSDTLSNASEVDGHTVKFEHTRTVTVNVEDSNGTAIDNGTAYLLDSDGNVSQSVSITNGTADFTGVSDATGYSVDVNVSGYQNVSSSNFEVDGDETLNATLYEDGANSSSTIEFGENTSSGGSTGGSTTSSSGIPAIAIVLALISIVGGAFFIIVRD